jgi:hypothetical protein
MRFARWLCGSQAVPTTVLLLSGAWVCAFASLFASFNVLMVTISAASVVNFILVRWAKRTTRAGSTQ